MSAIRELAEKLDLRSRMKGDLVVSMPKDEAPIEQPSERRATVVGSLGKQINSVFDKTGISVKALADELSDELGEDVIPTRLHSWMTGVTPSVEPERVASALNRILKRHPTFKGGRWVPGDQVKAEIARWRKHLTTREIQAVVGGSHQRIHNWTHGNNRVQRKTFIEAKENIEAELRKRGIPGY